MTRFCSYEIGKRLGNENTGRQIMVSEGNALYAPGTYLANDPAGNTCILKLVSSIPHSLLPSPAQQVLAIVTKEIQRHQSPHVINLIDIVEDSGYLALVFAHVQGETLASYSNAHGRFLSVPRALNVMRQLCCGLAFLHGKGLAHLDLKPANIVIVPTSPQLAGAEALSGTACIIDLGSVLPIARPGYPQLSPIEPIYGTPPYAAPELMAHGSPNGVGYAADIWSCGVMLFELLTGNNMPYGQLSGDLDAMIEQIRQRPIDFHRFPQPVAHILRVCLDKHARQRFRSAEKLLGEIEQALQLAAPGSPSTTVAAAPRPAPAQVTPAPPPGGVRMQTQPTATVTQAPKSALQAQRPASPPPQQTFRRQYHNAQYPDYSKKLREALDAIARLEMQWKAADDAETRASVGKLVAKAYYQYAIILYEQGMEREQALDALEQCLHYDPQHIAGRNKAKEIREDKLFVKLIVCKECGQEFKLTIEDQRHFRKLGLAEPARDEECRQQRREREAKRHLRPYGRIRRLCAGGYGFIERLDQPSSQDIFFHYSDCPREMTPQVGMILNFRLVADGKGLHAEEIRGGK